MKDNWYGMMTIDNVGEIVEVIEKILTGKKYTFVAVNMAGNDSRPGFLISEPFVRTGQEMKPGRDGKPVDFWREDGYAGFNVCDSYGVWGASTYTNDPSYDRTFQNPYIVFEYGHTIRITHRAAAGHMLYWVIAVEKE